MTNTANSARVVSDGIWQWTARHPAWKVGEAWRQVVSSYAVDVGTQFIIFDPLGLPPEIEERAQGRATSVVLTCPWHVRDAVEVARTLEAQLFVPPPDVGDAPVAGATVFEVGDFLPCGVAAFAGREPNDPVLWVSEHKAIVAGDSLVDLGNGLVFPADWAADDYPAGVVLSSLREILSLPIEIVLPTHGDPADRAALERALQA
jgi:glyoxylase-like metal-dependent hydrolase (beta-lactamase superfamily II)